MTPKEKAQELVESFAECIKPTLTFDVLIVRDLRSAKQCALITVDEIINMSLCAGCKDCCIDINYWQEVKTELEKL